MRVLFIDVNCKQGSTGKIVYDLYSHLVANGEEAAVCYGRGPKLKEKNIYKFGLDWETYLHAFLTRITGFTGCYSYFSTKRLIRFIKKFRPDVVHIHELHAYFINVVQLLNYLKKQDIKIVHTLHCAFSYTGKCGHHLECEGWKNSCGNCPRLKEYVSTLWFDHTKRMLLKKKKAFDGFKDLTIVCPSEWLANYARQSFLGKYDTRVIHNGIDTNVFYPRETDNLRKKLCIKDDERIVLSVAPNLMSNAKGGKWVLDLAENLQNEKIKFILVGVEDANIEHGNNVLLFERTTNQDELAIFYSLADLFIICSEMENFPTTCLEAQCCGTPVCGFDVGGARETQVIRNSFAFVPYASLGKLETTVVQLLSIGKDKELSNKAIQKFSLEKFLLSYLSFYKGN